MRFLPSRQSWFGFFNNPVFHWKIRSGTLFAQLESNGGMLCALKAHPIFPEGTLPETSPENVTGPARRQDRLEDRRIRSKTNQPRGSARAIGRVLHYRSTTLLVTRAPGFYNPPKVAPEAMDGLSALPCPTAKQKGCAFRERVLEIHSTLRISQEQ